MKRRENKTWQIGGFPHIVWGHVMPDHDSTCELSKSVAHPCPHVPCSSCSQRQRLHHAYGVVESKDRGWIAQFCSVPCSSGNKSMFLWLAAKGKSLPVSACLFTITKQSTSSSKAQSVTQSWISPGSSPHSCGFIYCITLHIITPC